MFLFLPFGGQQSDFVDRKCSKSFFRNVLPTQARNTFLKTCGAKSELEHKNHERGNFEACIFDANSYPGAVRIVFLHLARRVPSEMKIIKSRWMVGLRRPGGMSGGAGREFREG